MEVSLFLCNSEIYASQICQISDCMNPNSGRYAWITFKIHKDNLSRIKLVDKKVCSA